MTPTGKAAWPDRALVVTLPSGQRIQSSRFNVLENGKPVLGAKVIPAAGNFGVALVIDASDSMRGTPIESAMAAARAFADRRNPQEQLAVVAFNSDAHVITDFTALLPHPAGSPG